MLNQEEIKFLELLEGDLKTLEEALLNIDEDLKEIFKLIRNTIPFFTIEFSYFIELLIKYCFSFQNESEIKNIEKTTLLDRINLFKRIFIENIKSSEYLTKSSVFLHDSHSGGPVFEPILLFYSFYYAMFVEYLTSMEDVLTIFERFKNQWMESLQSHTFPVKIIIHMPIFTIAGEHQINDKIKLISARPPLKIRKKRHQERVYLNYILSYYPFGMEPSEYMNYDYKNDLDNLTNMRIYLSIDCITPYYLFNEFSSYNGLYEKILKKKEELDEYIKEFTCCLYLLGKEFEYRGFIIEYPWWFVANINRFDKFDDPIRRAVFVSDEELNLLNQIYQKVRESGIFNENKFEIVKYRFFQIFNNRYVQDLLLDYFIILEFFFTRGIMAELKFRLSLNSALFLSSDWNEFNILYKFFGDLYGLRSVIIHGSDVKYKINNFIKKHKFENIHHFLFEIKRILSKIILKFISIKLEDPQILKKFERPHFFLKNSNLTSGDDTSAE